MIARVWVTLRKFSVKRVVTHQAADICYCSLDQALAAAQGVLSLMESERFDYCLDKFQAIVAAALFQVVCE